MQPITWQRLNEWIQVAARLATGDPAHVHWGQCAQNRSWGGTHGDPFRGSHGLRCVACSRRFRGKTRSSGRKTPIKIWATPDEYELCTRCQAVLDSARAPGKASEADGEKPPQG